VHLRAARVVTAVAAGAVCLAAVVGSTGLWGVPRGAGDNNDGYRLFCGVGLVPSTPDGRSDWRGAVVLMFHRGPVCADSIPSSGRSLLHLAASSTAGEVSLVRLAWLYTALLVLVVSVAAWSATVVAIRRVLILVPVVLPLADPDFTRFFLSTYAEPAGLLGAVMLLCGVAALTQTRVGDRAARVTAVALVGGGGVLAVTAKLAYAPVLLVALVVCASTPVTVRYGAGRWSSWVTGPVVVVVAMLAAAGPIIAAMDYQARVTAGFNSYNLAFTLVLTEVPGSAGALGLPPTAAAYAGRSFFAYPSGPTGVPGADIVAADPRAARSAALRVLASHPAALLHAVGVGLQATEGSDVSYLPAVPYAGQPRPVATGRPLPVQAGEGGADAPLLGAWLDTMRAPWLPSALVFAGLFAGAVNALRRRRGGLTSGAVRVAAVAAAAALGLAAVAVLGDGYFEIAKHAWLAAYAVDVAAYSLLTAGVVTVARLGGVRSAFTRAAAQRATRSRGRTRSSGAVVTGEPMRDGGTRSPVGPVTHT